MGDNYSGRIWANRDALAHSLDTIIPRGIAAGRNPRVIARDIRRATGASKYNAERLARTEFAHMANRATFDAYEETGVERYQIDAALDLRTCKVCGDQDRKIYAVKDRKEAVNAPTFHPNCRCSTIPYFEPDDIDAMFDAPTRIARGADGSHYHVPADMTYNEWKAKYVDGDPGLQSEADGDILRERGGGGRISGINNIDSPIEQRNTGKGNPNAILHFGRPLNNRQQSLLDRLPDYDDRVTVPKSSVSMSDLAALTAETGVEFAMFTQQSDRLIIRGNEKHVNISPEKARELNAEGWRWSGHTHPGITDLGLTASDGDHAILNEFTQTRSVIYDARGRFQQFIKDY